MSFPTPATRASIVFVADPAADLILKSSDGVWFPIRRVFLQAASEVFDGMLSTGTGSNADAKDPKTGLVVVQLDDKAAELDILLRFIDRDQSRVSKEGKPLSLGETMSLIHLADKYGAKALIDAVDLSSIRSAVAVDPPKLFGFAMAHGLIETARDALALFQKTFAIKVVAENVPYYDRDGYSCVRTETTRTLSEARPHLLSQVPKDDLARIPFDVLHELQNAQERVHLEGTEWAVEAKKIKLT